ncbi:dephospho-CoA kinase [Aridibaculum aurantiacum]|uniref:dephospho-CoA kinase n=1 Tax=Aridibaculum aurantiacum TaxID=2810307 RepID=UPI001A97AB84|nr:dephospho-CoA kinase [Aridibaculum aurantiacum]
MLKIGLTGGIGSGKTAVAKIFEVLGIPVFYADAQAKEIMTKDKALVAAITGEFGAEVYTDGVLNRPYLANVVFNDPFKLEKLNAIVHPATIRAADAWMAEQKAPYVIKEAALLFEAGSAGHLDLIIGVYAPQHLRMKRVMDRDGVTRDEVIARMNRQIQETVKMRLCDHVVVNDEQQLVIPQVLALHKQFLQLAIERKGDG